MVEANFASALDDPALRECVGRIVDKVLREAHVGNLMDAIDRLKEDAHRRGLTDQIIDEELAAYNSEHRDTYSHAE